jgi:serine-type D-Ala-D-Ala carboxypeptidase (penicillin-binding protein 5/6)
VGDELRMRKRIISILLITIVAFEGCKSSSEKFLAFEESTEIAGYSLDNNLTEGTFFAEDIAVVTASENVGGDEELISGASLLVNATEDEVIYADHVFDKMYPASLTKLLTALVILRYGELTDQVSVSYDATHITEANAKVCGFKEGDILTLEALLNCLLIYSGNDAAIAAADHVGGSEEAFVELMNHEAAQIGAIHSNFVNSHGLHDEDHYTTAYDIYLIFNELLKFDSFRKIINTDSYTVKYTDSDGTEKEKTFNSTNQYLTDDNENDLKVEVVGGKTGTTTKAGNCLVILCKDSADQEYIAVILKAADSDRLYSQMSHLLTKISDE